MPTDDEFLSAFETGAITVEEWNHSSHVRLAYTYLKRYGYEYALARMRPNIVRQLERIGVPATIDSGYHETLTVVWMRLVHNAISAHGAQRDFEAFCAEHPYLLTRKLIRTLYTRDRLVSWEAKREFVEPNLLQFANVSFGGDHGPRQA